MKQTKWEIHRASTPSRVVDKFRYRVDLPVGVVVFGADGEFKEDVTLMFEAEFPGMVKVMERTSSTRKNLRRKAVAKLRKAGAKTVIGVSVSARTTNLDATGQEVDRMLREVPAQAEEFDYMVVVEE